jgi:hypothetical protein
VGEIGFSLPKGTTNNRSKGTAMNKLTRIMTMGGFGLLAAVATGVGPAQAATSNIAPESKPAVGHAQWRDGGDTVGYYRSVQECEMAGQFGERSGDWDDHDCNFIRLGFRHGTWALQVASDNDWDRNGFGVPFRAIHGFPNQFRPAWPGQFRPGFPGQNRPGFPGQNRPGFPGQNRPGFPGQNRPGFPGQNRPATGNQNGPAAGNQNGPTAGNTTGTPPRR